MEINQMVFNELLKRGYSVRGKNKVWTLADSRLLYITPELAKGFLNLTKFKVYKKKIYDIEVKLLKDNALNILKPFENRDFNLIDLGCGDGSKAKEFIKSLKNKGKLRYCPVDISSYFIDKAISGIKSGNFKNVRDYESNVSDFDNLDNIVAYLRNDKYQKNMSLLLGCTLSNFEINDFLFNLSSAMFEKDYLIIGNGIRTGPRLVSLETYKNKAFDNWFIWLMNELGFKKNEVEYDARFTNSRLECFYRIKVNKKINHLGHKVEFKKGDQIVVAFLYKYYENELVDFTKRYFSSVEVVKDPDNEYALLICKK
jgi:uncharacterized SAM-dependent methyltransferase